MNRKCLIFNTILLLLSAHLLSAQQKQNKQQSFLMGRVITSNTDETLPGVNIYLPELKQGTVTDNEGDFQLEISQRAGNLLIQLSFVGYKTRLIRLALDELSSSQIFIMEPDFVEVNEVIVSAGRIASRDEIPVTVEKMTIKEMRAGGQINTMSSLMKIPGVEQIAYGTGIGKPVIRGMSFSRILSMYQGVRFENQQWGADHGLGVNDLGIEAVEVIKGPASFLYGSGALGGVVFMVDERPAPEGKILAEANSTFHSNTLGLRQTIGLRQTTNSGWFYGIYAALENHTDYLDGNGRTIGNSRFNTSTLRANTGVQRSWGMIKAAYTYHLQNLGIIADNERQNTLATERNDRTMQLPFQEVEDHLFTVNANFVLGTGRLETSLGHHLNTRREIESAINLTDLGLIQQNTTFNARYFLESGASEHIFGLQGFYLQNKNMADVEEILIPDAQLYDASAYYLFTHRKQNTTYQAGLRYDGRSTTGDATAQVIRDYGYNFPDTPPEQRTLSVSHTGISGSAGMIHQLNKQFNFKANFSSGFRAPDLAELFSYGEHPGTQRFETGDINSQREQNFQLDFVAAYENTHFSIEASPFVNFINNYIYFTPTGERKPDSDLTIWAFEQNNARLYGGELSAKLRPLKTNKLELNASFATVRGMNTDLQQNMPLIPADKILSSAQWNFSDWEFLSGTYFKFNYNYVFEQDRLSPRERMSYGNLATPAFNLFGASAGSKMQIGKQSFLVNLAVNNLFNTSYVDHLSFLRPFNINNIGRNFTLNLNIPIHIQQ